MRIPKINAYRDTSGYDSVVENIDIDLLEDVEYYQNIDPENTKEFPKVIRTYKMLTRASFEYKEMAKFLKAHHDMNQSFFFKGIKHTEDKKFSLEIHHAPFTLEDIVATVILKRLSNGESTNHMDVCREIMHLHYAGAVGLIPLDRTSHALIHSPDAPELFAPIQHIPFGECHRFYKEYKKYIPDNVKATYAYIQDLSMKYERISDIIPSYMKPKALYYEGFIKIEKFEELLDEIERSNSALVNV